MKAKFQNFIFVIAAMLLTSTLLIAQDSTNDDWRNNNITGSQNELDRLTITTTQEAAAKITFGNGTGSISTYGLNSESVPLPNGTKGLQVGVRAVTSSNYGIQAGSASGSLGVSKSFIGDGAFSGVRGAGLASALSTFDANSIPSYSVGGYFLGGAESGTTLDIGSDKAYVGGSYNVLTGDINGTPGEGTAAAVIGIDESTGTTPSYASYFEGNQNYMSGKLGIGTKAPASTLSVGGDGDSRYASYFYKTATTNGDAALYAQMPRPTSASGWFSPVAGIIESGTGYARGLFGSSYNSTPQNSGRSYGLYAQAGNATNRANFGVFAHLRGQNSGAAVLGWDGVAEPGWSTLLPTNDSWAGYFIGDVNVTESLGVGVSAPTQALDVGGNANVRGNFLNVGQDAGASAAYLRIGSGRTADGIAAIDCIGTTAYPLYGFRFGHTGAGNSIMFHRGTSPFIIQNTEAADLHIRTNSINRVVVKDNGQVGIGTTAPDACALLDVNGAIGYNGTLCNTSDKRLKKDARDFDYGLEEVINLDPIYYNYNGKAGTDSEQTHVGIYAQDLKKVAPELVGEFKYEETEIEITEDGQEVDVKTNVKKSAETYLNINESSIKYMLINAVKEQQDIIETQKDEIATLREEMSEVKEMMQAVLNGQNIDTNTSINQQNIQLNGRGAYLEQNQPNPFNTNTLIKYNLPVDAADALVNIFNENGQLIHSETITQTGAGQIQVKAGTIPAGTYSYSLVVNGKITDTKRMVIVK